VKKPSQGAASGRKLQATSPPLTVQHGAGKGVRILEDDQEYDRTRTALRARSGSTEAEPGHPGVSGNPTRGNLRLSGANGVSTDQQMAQYGTGHQMEMLKQQLQGSAISPSPSGKRRPPMPAAPRGLS